MAKVKCRFTGARPLKDGSLTGMLIFENVSKADRHALLDLEGEVYLTNEDSQGEDNKLLIEKELLAHFERITAIMADIGVLPTHESS